MSKSNEEKKALINKFKQDLKPDQYEQFIKDARNYKLLPK